MIVTLTQILLGEQMGKERTHIVKKGENLEKIAKIYGYKSWAPLWKVNKKALEKKGRTPQMLHVGDKLVVPLSEKEKQERMVRMAILTAQKWYAEMQAAKYDSWAKEWDSYAKHELRMEARDIQFADNQIRELRSDYNRVMNVGEFVDRGQMLIDIGRRLAKLSLLAKKSATASVDQLKGINDEAKKIAKELLNVPRGALRDEVAKELKKVAHKYVSVELRGGLKDAADTLDAVKKTANDMTSLKFGFKIIAGLKSGKGWTESIQYDFKEEMDKHVSYWERYKMRNVKSHRVNEAFYKEQARKCRELANFARTKVKLARFLEKIDA